MMLYKLYLIPENREYQNNYETFETTSLSIFGIHELENVDDFPKQYAKIEIPQIVVRLLSLLLKEHGLSNFQQEFLTLLCAYNYVYHLFNEDVDDSSSELFTDLNDYKKDITQLIDLLALYIHPGTTLKKISFQHSDNHRSLTIKNTFLINDILGILSSHLGLDNPDNHIQRTKLIDDATFFNYHKGVQYVKFKMINCLYDFLQKNLSQSRKLKFIGVFSTLSQVPIIATSKPLIYSDIITLKEDVEIKSLRHYISREHDFFS